MPQYENIKMFGYLGAGGGGGERGARASKIRLGPY